MWKRQLSIFFLLLYFFCFPLAADSISEVEIYKQLEQNTEKQSRTVSEKSKSLADRLMNLEMLADRYLDELSQSEEDWEKFLKRYSELQIAVRELTLSVEHWSLKYENLFHSYESTKESLETERDWAKKEISSIKKELYITRVCVIILGGIGVYLLFR